MPELIDTIPCTNCNGTGTTSHKRKTRFINTINRKCRTCNGDGEIMVTITMDCDG